MQGGRQARGVAVAEFTASTLAHTPRRLLAAPLGVVPVAGALAAARTRGAGDGGKEPAAIIVASAALSVMHSCSATHRTLR